MHVHEIVVDVVADVVERDQMDGESEAEHEILSKYALLSLFGPRPLPPLARPPAVAWHLLALRPQSAATSLFLSFLSPTADLFSPDCSPARPARVLMYRGS